MWPFDLAYAIVNYCIDLNSPISNLRLNKIMYFCQIENYRKNKEPLLYPNSFEAWSYGSVVRDVYVKYCLLGGSPIKQKEECEFELPDFLKNVVDTWLHQSPWALRSENCKHRGAWEKTYIEGLKRPIPENLIRQEASEFY